MQTLARPKDISRPLAEIEDHTQCATACCSGRPLLSPLRFRSPFSSSSGDFGTAILDRRRPLKSRRFLRRSKKLALVQRARGEEEEGTSDGSIPVIALGGSQGESIPLHWKKAAGTGIKISSRIGIDPTLVEERPLRRGEAPPDPRLVLPSARSLFPSHGGFELNLGRAKVSGRAKCTVDKLE